MKSFYFFIGLFLSLYVSSSVMALMSETESALPVELLALQRKNRVATVRNPEDIRAVKLAEHNRQVMESMSRPPNGFNHFDHPPAMTGHEVVSFITTGAGASTQVKWITVAMLFGFSMAALAALKFIRHKPGQSDAAMRKHRF